MAKSNSNVLYYEPNYSSGLIATGNGANDIVQLAPPMEDYCVVVDLAVEVPVRPLYGQVKTGDKILHVRYTSSIDGKAKVSFNQGRKYPGSDDYYLTTEPFEMGTFYDISSDSGNTAEMFGINSITIEYQTYMVPVVTIQFTDIRGLSLFGAEDLRHNVTSEEGIKYSVNDEIAGSFFKCFFTFPYPKFNITVKGFYGNPVSYELTCADFRANFDSSTGNFGATAKFVGYSFSVLNDLTITSLLASPYSEYFGKKYWENNQDRFIYSNGKQMRPILELMKDVESMASELTKLESDNKLNELNEKSNRLKNVEIAHNNYITTLSSILTKSNTNNCIIGNNCRIASITNLSGNTDSLDEIYTQLRTYVNDSGLKLILPPKFGDKTLTLKDLKKYGYYGCSDGDIIEYFEESLSGSNVCYIYDGSELLKLITENKNSLETSIKNRQSEVEKIKNNKLEEILGFKPSVQNITELILAHVETFIHELYACAESVIKLPKNSNIEFRTKNENGDKDAFYAFPTVTSAVTENGITKTEKAWIGSFDLSAPETQLVESLLNATKQISEETKRIENNLTENNEVFNLPLNVEIPVTPCDFIGNSNPYTNITLSDNYDICGKILMRVLLINSSVVNITQDGLMYDIGVADAKNFYKNNAPTSEFIRKAINDNGTFTVENIVNLLSGNDNDLSGNNVSWINQLYSLKNLVSYDDGKFSCDYVKNSKNGKCLIPVNDFNWEKLRLAVSTSITNTIDNSDAYYTQGFASRNANRFFVSKDWDKYSTYTPPTVEGLDVLNNKYNFNITNGNICSYYSNIYDINSMVGLKLSMKYKGIDLYDNKKFPTVIPLALVGKDSYSNKECILESDDDKIEIISYDENDNEIKYELETITEDDIKNIYQNKLTDVNNYTINYLCGFYDGKVNENFSIFGQLDYYNLLAINKKAAALMFLSSFNLNYDIFKHDLITNNVFYCPYLVLITLGGYFYKIDNEKEFSNITDIEWLDMSELYEELADEIKIELIFMFEEWFRNEFDEINNQLSIHTKSSNYTVNNFFSELFTKCKGTDNSAKNIIDFLRDKLQDNFFENYSIIQYYEDTTFYGKVIKQMLKLIHRETSDYISKLTNLFFTPYIVINCIGNPIKKPNALNINEILRNILNKYLSGFVEGIRQYGNDIVSTDTSTTSNIVSTQTNEQIKIALYNYLKIIWDRWLSGNPKEGGKTIWDLDKLKERWHYLDSYYNKLTDKATINIIDFVKDIVNAYDTIGCSALSVMSSTYARSRYLLLCVQNFASLINDELMRDMFKPIPYNSITTSMVKSLPDFIVMYTNEPSSKLDIPGSKYKNDSYMIGGEESQLPQAILTKEIGKNNEKGYKIPAFGVTFGGQYQSYFKDIQVGMENPQVTDQSLQAQFEIVKKLDTNDAIAVGQDLFTIYSNQSFTCTVKMMGCAWVQPLMYFQLNNIPMFKGTYLIQKVTHSISPGNMETVFTGTRMSSLSTPFVENGLLSNSSFQSGGDEDNVMYQEWKEANIYNDCEYKYFNPLYSSIDNGISENVLNMTVKEYGLTYGNGQYDGWSFDLSSKYGKTMKELIADIMFGEAGGLDDLSLKIIVGVLFNRYKSAGNNFCKVLYNSAQHETSKNCPENLKSRYEALIDEICINTPYQMVGETTHILKKVPIWNNGVNTNTYSSVKTINEHDVKSMDAYCTTNGYDTNYNRTKNPNEPLEPKDGFWHKGEYLFQHDGKERNGHVIVASGWQSSKPGTEHWQPQQNKYVTSNDEYPSVLANNLFDSIKKTIEYSDNIKISNISMSGLDKNNIDSFKITCSSDNGMAQIFDVILNTYYDHFSELYWVVDKSGSELPKYIQVKACENADKIIAVGVYDKSTSNQVSVINQYNGLNELFYLSLHKRYGDLSVTSQLFKIECRNFTSITSKENWETEVKGLLNGEVLPCPNGNKTDDSNNILSGARIGLAAGGPMGAVIGGAVAWIADKLNNSKYSWNGVDVPQNKQLPQTVVIYNPNILKAVEYIKDKVKSNTDEPGNCAAYVREALMSPNGGNFVDIKVYPYSACCYAKHLPSWGFKCVYRGVSKEPISDRNYKPETGDIVVIAGVSGNNSKSHGHIQMYDANTNLWYSDYAESDIWCYNSPGRPYMVFRYPNKN